MLLLDTSAWIEFFIKSEQGKLVKEYLEKEQCFTSVVSIAEIADWASRQKLDKPKLLKYVINLSQILELNLKTAHLSGLLNFERKKTEKNWGIVDSIILATSQFYDIEILTKDRHFKDLPNVILL